jgi:hypothetical protein
MEGLVGPHCGALGEAVKQAPADDGAWEKLAVSAALLNEAGHFLMDDGRCPDGEWAKASEMLRTGSAAVHAKIEAKDHAGMSEAFGQVGASCATCHKAHKKD